MSARISGSETQFQTITALGRGGMGEVFLAAMPGPPGLNQLAVIKRIWPELADDLEFVAMFLDEARLALRLRHRNIVRTFEIGQGVLPPVAAEGGAGADARYFIAMEYLAGQPLSQILRRLRGSRAFGIQLRLQVLVEVLHALEYAHGLCDPGGTPLGVVHRDLSPDNIFITYDGAVKLMDFGIAKSITALHQTRPGVWKGRFAYGAPEQLRGGGAVDQRTDLFALGLILWELITDRALFRGRSESEIVQVLSGPQPLPALPDTWPVPAELRFVTARALALAPAARYQSAAELRRDLEDVLTNCLSPEPRPLGRVIACAFAPEKQSLEGLIERFFATGDRDGQSGDQAWSAAGAPAALAPARRDSKPTVTLGGTEPAPLVPTGVLPAFWSATLTGLPAVASEPATVVQPTPFSAAPPPPTVAAPPATAASAADPFMPPPRPGVPSATPTSFASRAAAVPTEELRPFAKRTGSFSAPAIQIEHDLPDGGVRRTRLYGRLGWPQAAFGTVAVALLVFMAGQVLRTSGGDRPARGARPDPSALVVPPISVASAAPRPTIEPLVRPPITPAEPVLEPAPPRGTMPPGFAARASTEPAATASEAPAPIAPTPARRQPRPVRRAPLRVATTETAATAPPPAIASPPGRAAQPRPGAATRAELDLSDINDANDVPPPLPPPPAPAPAHLDTNNPYGP